MLVKETEISKVNSSELSAYERLLDKIETEENSILFEFDVNIEKILGKTLFDYLNSRNLITPAFLSNFHFSDIPIEDSFQTKDGVISVRDYYRMKVSGFLKEKTDALRKEIEDKELSGKLLDKYTPKAFALASIGLLTFHRKKNMKLRDVQKLAALGMAYGEIAELATGEGKTIAAVPCAFFHALRGKGVHVVTANSYLSKRDFIELAPVYEGLGLTCGYVQSSAEEKNSAVLKKSKKAAYRCDVTYSPKDEVAFDYLRDSVAKSVDDVVTRGGKTGFGIIDEVDDVLVDAANSPYVIAGRPPVYQDDMTIEDLANAMSIPVDLVLRQLSVRKIKVQADTKLTHEDAIRVADLFSKNLQIDSHDKLLTAQAFYAYLNKVPVPINPEDKPILEKFKGLISYDNGIMRVKDARLYMLLSGDEQDLKSASYYGKYAFDPNDIYVLRKYAKLVVCPTSNAFYINNNTFEEYLARQYLASKEVISLVQRDRDKILKYLRNTDYTVSKKGEINLTPSGLKRIYSDRNLINAFPEIASGYDKLINHKNELGSFYYHVLSQTIIANEMLHLNEDYTISEGKIVLLKNAREMVGSTYTQGLHQAIEMKEFFNGRVRLTNENPSLASITQKDYYGRYEMYCGMTGTTAKKVFNERYGKNTLRVPRDAYYSYYSERLRLEGMSSEVEPLGIDKRRPVFAKNNKDKYSLILQSIKESHRVDPPAPVLIVFSDPNELFEFEKFLKENGVEPNVIENSRLGTEDKRGMESVKVARAGRSGMITLATMMAGRGTDIKLGGDRDTIIEYATNKTMRDHNLSEKDREEVRILCEDSLLKQGLIYTKEKEEEERKALERVGLKVISVGFFASERIDRQLEGRTGRNGISGITERYSSPEDLEHFGLERVHEEPVKDLFERTGTYGDGSLKLLGKDYEKLMHSITVMQNNNDNAISESILFTQDVSSIATEKLEEVRDSRRKLLEITKDDETLLANKEQITEEVVKMLTLTIDDLIVSFMGNNNFAGKASIVINPEEKKLAAIDYEGLRLACKEVLGIDMNMESFEVGDSSILEFRNALIDYAKSVHDRAMKCNEKIQLRRDVEALLHKDDHELSSITDHIDYIRKQKAFDYITRSDIADDIAVIGMGTTLKDLRCESCVAGSKLLFGRILLPKEKKELEAHRKAMFDYQMVKDEPLESLSTENDSESIAAFRRIAKKTNEAAKIDREDLDDKIASRIKKGKSVDIEKMYQNLILRPRGFQLSLDGKFSLIKTYPSSLEIMEGRKLI